MFLFFFALKVFGTFDSEKQSWYSVVVARWFSFSFSAPELGKTQKKTAKNLNSGKGFLLLCACVCVSFDFPTRPEGYGVARGNVLLIFCCCYVVVVVVVVVVVAPSPPCSVAYAPAARLRPLRQRRPTRRQGQVRWVFLRPNPMEPDRNLNPAPSR